jgi:hypothetical protein
MSDLRTAAQQALEQPEQGPVAWPKGRDLFLRDDMGKGQLRVMFDGDNDVIVAIWPHDKPSASVEFCNGFNGGGKSLETRKALIALMCAMERDGAHARPHVDNTGPLPRAALEQPEQDTDCHAQGICQRSGYGIGQPEQVVPYAVWRQGFDAVRKYKEQSDQGGKTGWPPGQAEGVEPP